MRLRELARVSRMLSKEDVMLDRPARQRALRTLGQLLPASRRGIRDDERPANQNRHTCEREKLKFGGERTSPNVL